MEQLVEIGRTGKTHGASGELRIFIEDAYLDDFLEAGLCFLRLGTSDVPYFVETIRGAGSDIVKLEEIENPQDAKPLTNKTVLLPKEKIMSTKQPSPPLQMLKGYLLTDLTAHKEVTILEVEEYPQQMIAQVSDGQQNWLIPLHKSFIEEIKQESRQVVVRLAEGIWEL